MTKKSFSDEGVPDLPEMRFPVEDSSIFESAVAIVAGLSTMNNSIDGDCDFSATAVENTNVAKMVKNRDRIGVIGKSLYRLAEENEVSQYALEEFVSRFECPQDYLTQFTSTEIIEHVVIEAERCKHDAKMLVAIPDVWPDDFDVTMSFIGKDVLGVANAIFSVLLDMKIDARGTRLSVCYPKNVFVLVVRVRKEEMHADDEFYRDFSTKLETILHGVYTPNTSTSKVGQRLSAVRRKAMEGARIRFVLSTTNI